MSKSSPVTRVMLTPAGSPTSYSLLPYIGQGQLSLPNEDVEVVLHDEESQMDAIRGLAMETVDCAFPCVRGVSVTCSLKQALAGVDMLVILPTTGSCQTNHADIVQNAMRHASPHVKVVVAGTKQEYNDIMYMNTVLSEDRFLFIETSKCSSKPMSLANKVSCEIQKWLRKFQHGSTRVNYAKPNYERLINTDSIHFIHGCTDEMPNDQSIHFAQL